MGSRFPDLPSHICASCSFNKHCTSFLQTSTDWKTVFKSFKTWVIFDFTHSKIRLFPFTEGNITNIKLTKTSLKICMKGRHLHIHTMQTNTLLGFQKHLQCMCKSASGSAVSAFPSCWSHALCNVSQRANTSKNFTLYAFLCQGQAYLQG